MRKLFVVLMLVAFCSCEQKTEEEKEIEAVDVDLELLRFDRDFANATPDDLPQLKRKYPYLFPEQFPDSVWVEQMNDTIQAELDEEVGKKFADFSEQEDQLHEFFQHLKYHFPEIEIPKIITITSEVDYENKVIVADSLLLISLDTYLGEDHFFYLGMQQYLKKNFEPSQIVPDVAHEYAEHLVPRPESRTLLANMIYYGKILYLKDVLIPFKSDADKMGYTEEELEWAQTNEDEIWRYFVDREMLFKTDSKLFSRFLYPGPFTKFYLELDNESPDRLGQYIGWQMVRKYMEETDASLRQLLVTDAETIFREANYKPRK